MLSKQNEYLNYLGSIVMFTGVRKYFSSYYDDKKLGSNVGSILHACLSSGLSLIFLLGDNYNLLYGNNLNKLDIFIRSLSTGYFIYDLVLTLKNQKGIMRLAYSYHHVASLVLLDQNRLKFPIYPILFLAEASNIPSNIVYHHIKNNSDKNIITKWKNIQKYIYLFIRIPLLGFISLNYYNNNKHDVNVINKYYFMFPVYLMGVVWSYKLLKK